MQEAEVEGLINPVPRCRLCLQWTDVDDVYCGLENIFSADDDSLSFKIRDCVGVFVSPEDTIQTICTNCRQTVNLIDEFRLLCRQTEEIYESVAICCEDSGTWERYAENVGELRRLVQEHKTKINGHLVGVGDVEGTADEDSISQHFVPMLIVKDEPADDEKYLSDGPPMAMEVLDIKPDLPTDESEEDADENDKAELSDVVGSASFLQQIKLAEEVLKRLKRFTSNVENHKQLWTEIAKLMDMEYTATRTRWNRMKRRYMDNKASAATASQQTILRLKGCTLFNLMNQIVPELYDSVEPWVAPDSEDIENRTGRKIVPLGLKIAIAEEIKKCPELWDTSLASSTHKMDLAWKNIAKKFEMDAINLRFHWRSLQDLYRTHRRRLRLGVGVRTKADTQFYKLIDILKSIYQVIDAKQVAEADDSMVEEANQPTVPEEQQLDEDAEENAEENDDAPKDSQKMVLAKLVYQYKHLWNQKHQDFHNTMARDATWDKIAVTMEKTREEVKYSWKCLRDLYRGRVKRLKQGSLRHDARVLHEPLFKQLELMFAGNMRIGSARPIKGRRQASTTTSARKVYESESDEAQEERGGDDDDTSEVDENMKLAVLCEKHDIIWNSKHPDHANMERRDIVWDSIALKMNLTRPQTKAMWTRLRNVYRGRRLRLLRGNLAKNSPLLREPLHQKLNAMLKDHMHLGKYGGGTKKGERTKKGDAGPFPGMEDKVRLVEEVIKHEFLWNATHPDFHNAVIRDNTWRRIAVALNKSSAKVKYAYKLLRDSYRSRMKRMKQSNTDPTAHFEHDPLFKKMHTMFSKSMKIDRAKARKGYASVADESESNDVLEDCEDDDTIQYDMDETLKLALLCEKHELIWNSKHPYHFNHEKRDAVWHTISVEMNLSKGYVKEMWTRLRNIYRTRRLRYLQGTITRKNHLLCDPLYQKLHSMLDGHMQLGKHGGGFPKTNGPGKKPADTGPFSSLENKVKLVEEVFKHEHLWNTTHVDYFKSDKRGATWSQIAAMFNNCDAWAARGEWRRLRNMHRPRRSRAVVLYEPAEEIEEPEPAISNPLFELFSKMAESLAAENEDPAEGGEPSGTTRKKRAKKRQIEELTEAYMTHKRRYTGKRSFDDEGCIKVTKGGIVRYEKICELCGKQIERSYFEYHMNQHNGLKPYVCSIEGCGRQYSNKITRDRHEVMVHCDEGYKYECDQCDEKFKYRSTFDYHYAIKHESHQVPCNVCGKLLKHKSLLREHLRRHTGNFPCNVCGKILQKKYSLDVHMRTHTNEKPYPCEICGQCFMLKVQMKTHLAKIHQMSWEEFQSIYGSTSQQ